MELQTSGKRIVSKGEYVRLCGKRESIRFIGICLLLLAGALGFMAVFTIASMLGPHLLRLSIGLGLTIASCFAGKWGLESINASVKIDPGIPLTHVNITDLPAPDTLVRASAEPIQEQQAVLLRAAAAGRETPPEQLVRASTGEE